MTLRGTKIYNNLHNMRVLNIESDVVSFSLYHSEWFYHACLCPVI